MKQAYSKGWLYCYLRGDKAVFLNRWDETIKEFETYKEAELFANDNMGLIDIRQANGI